MSWYYAENDERRGPIDPAAFAVLVQTGTIRPETLVWREGLAGWIPYREAAATTSTVPAGAPPTLGPAADVSAKACSQCGRLFGADEMITYEGQAVCAECKPAFFQKVKEGAVVPGTVEYAGFWIRFGAKLIDGILLNIVGQLCALIVRSAVPDPQTATYISMALSFVIGASYTIYFVGTHGATPGKMACKLKVVRPEGQPLTFGRATGRYFAEYLSGLTLLIGYIMAAFDEEKRALHDRICDTRVVYRR